MCVGGVCVWLGCACEKKRQTEKHKKNTVNNFLKTKRQKTKKNQKQFKKVKIKIWENSTCFFFSVCPFFFVSFFLFFEIFFFSQKVC